MNDTMQSYLRKPLAALLLAEVATVLIPFLVLGSYFNFPDILRLPSAEAFVLFQQNGSVIVPAYYGGAPTFVRNVPSRTVHQSTDFLTCPYVGV